MALPALSAKAPVDLSILGGQFSAAPGVQTKPGFYFYGQRTLDNGKNTEGQDVPVLKWVASAQPKVITLDSVGVKVVWPDDEDGLGFFEASRTTHPETVPNNSGPGSFTVDVIDSITAKNKASKQDVIFDYSSGDGV